MFDNILNKKSDEIRQQHPHAEGIPIPDFFQGIIKFTYLACFLYYTTAYMMLYQELNTRISKSKELQVFAQKKEYKLPKSAHAEPVENIREWFEDRNVFFQPSLAELVEKNMDELTLSNSK